MTPKERRAPILARHEVFADPGNLRQLLERVESDLDDMGEETRRRVRLLLGALADLWTRQHGLRDEHTMVVDIDRLPDRVRIEAFSHVILPSRFWRGVGVAVAPGLASRWGVERRHRSGIWFEFEMPEDAMPSGSTSTSLAN